MKINKHESSQICSSDSSLLSSSVAAREYIKSRAVDLRVRRGRYVHLSRFHLWRESLNTLNQSGSCLWPGQAGGVNMCFEAVPLWAEPGCQSRPVSWGGRRRFQNRLLLLLLLRASQAFKAAEHRGFGRNSSANSHRCEREHIPAFLCRPHTLFFFCLFVSLMFFMFFVGVIKKRQSVLASYHSGGLFVSSTPYISASFLKRGPQSLR